MNNDIFLKQRNKIAVVGVITLVWWCILYPELCFPKDTYEVIYGTEDGIDIESSTEIPENAAILQADDEQIVVKSKLLEWLSQRKD